MLDSVKINVTLRQAALYSDEDIDINSLEIPVHEQQFLAYEMIQSNGHVARFTKPNREYPDLDNGNTTLLQYTERPSLKSIKDKSNFHPKGSVVVPLKGRKTLPTLPSEQLLQEIAAVKEELRRKHLSEVS